MLSKWKSQRKSGIDKPTTDDRQPKNLLNQAFGTWPDLIVDDFTVFTELQKPGVDELLNNFFLGLWIKQMNIGPGIQGETQVVLGFFSK